MAKKNAKKIKSLEEILEEIRLSSYEPEVPPYDEVSWQKVIRSVDELVSIGDKIQAICQEEPNILTDKPFLVNGPYLRQEFAERLSAALVEMEEILYLHTNTTSYDRFEISRFIGSNKKKNHEPVAIHIEEALILIKMPYLPKKYNGAVDVCNQLLAAKIFNTPDFPIWPKWAANYYHVFPTNLASISKDVDNYEYKRTNDILAYALGSSDNALRFSMSMTTVFTDKIAPGTYIEIVPKSSENLDSLNRVFGSQDL